MVIDDYGHWHGASKAVDEFFVARGLDPRLVEVDYSARYLRKGDEVPLGEPERVDAVG